MIINIDCHPPTLQQLQEWGIKKIVFDSRNITSGSLFCALIGSHTDGHQYIENARSSGVTTFLISSAQYAKDDLLYLLTTDTRMAMASLASVLYSHPSARIKTIGVTGTDGKSTSVYLIEQLLQLLGHSSGLISTVNLKTGGTIEENNMRQSTPEAPQIEEALQQMIDHGHEYAIIEATSHGLSDRTGRLSHIDFCAGLFTNVTIEHLEFHGTLEQYRNDKSNLFRNVAKNQGTSVINDADLHKNIFIEAARGSTILCYNSPTSDLYASDIEQLPAGNKFKVTNKHGMVEIFCRLPGIFNVENALGVLLLVSSLLQRNPLELAPLLNQLKVPKGRMVVVQKSPFTVIVDYAHTPGSFEKLLPTIKQSCKGRLIVLFGSGGERNIEKRPIQGRLADQWADIIILTDEDPRLEPSINILNSIAEGIKGKKINQNLYLISNRTEAISKAFDLAKEHDIVLLLGKGHEGSIIGPNGKTKWDEEQVAKELLSSLIVQ